MGKLDGKVVVLTGAAAGIGKQVAIRCATEGAKLAICDMNTDKLMITGERCEKAGAQVLAVTCDVSKYDELKAFVDKTVESFGKVDVLVNNAAFVPLPPRPFLEHDISILDSALQAGLYAVWHLMKLCFPHMKDKRASIINFSSGAGIVGLENWAAYAATKESIRGLSRVVAREWGVYGIRVNCICPAALTDTMVESLPPEFTEWVKSTMAENALRSEGNPYEDIAPVVVFLASDDSKYITGQNVNVDGGRVITA